MQLPKWFRILKLFSRRSLLRRLGELKIPIMPTFAFKLTKTASTIKLSERIGWLVAQRLVLLSWLIVVLKQKIRIVCTLSFWGRIRQVVLRGVGQSAATKEEHTSTQRIPFYLISYIEITLTASSGRDMKLLILNEIKCKRRETTKLITAAVLIRWVWPFLQSLHDLCCCCWVASARLVF